jgi:hypothetical protein
MTGKERQADDPDAEVRRNETCLNWAAWGVEMRVSPVSLPHLAIAAFCR